MAKADGGGASIVIQDIELPVAEAEDTKINANGGRAMGMGVISGSVAAAAALLMPLSKRWAACTPDQQRVDPGAPAVEEATLEVTRKYAATDLADSFQPAVRVFIPQKSATSTSVRSAQRQPGHDRLFA